ncbi:MAG: C40 family peptidase [Lachnospiraceae bacterium]|nr:C40 family peptidase [Lachnospiraceae bacterium]
MKKNAWCILLAVVMACTPVTVAAETSKEVKEQQEKTKEQLEQLDNEMGNIEAARDQAASELDMLDTQLIEILTSISICQDEIVAKEEEIKVVQGQLEEAQNREAQQYEDMKTRIRFMYERGDTSYMSIMTETDNFADMLNKAEYVEKLYAYDRKLLGEYAATKEEVITLKATLEEEEADLITSEQELQQEEDYLQQLITQKRATVDDFDQQLQSAKARVSSYKAQIQEQTERIKELEAAEKEEEERKAAEAKAVEDAKKINGDEATIPNVENSGSVTALSAGDDTASVSVSGSGTGASLASYGCQFIGNPYVFGGTSLTNGTDCSGFTQGVHAHFGISIPRDSTSQRFGGVGVDYANAMPGDVICYAGHVGLYIGNGQIVHASSERTGIKISNATYRTILAVRRYW